MKLKTLIMIGLGFFITSCENEDATPAIPTFDLKTIFPYHGFEGETINIRGVGFDPVASGNVVKFNGVEAEIERATSTTLAIQVPQNATNGKITVSVGDDTLESGVDFTVLHEATIERFAPEIIKADTTVVITGTNFKPNFMETIVKFGEEEASVTSITPTELKVIVPKEIAESGRVSVTINGRTAVSNREFTLKTD